MRTKNLLLAGFALFAPHVGKAFAQTTSPIKVDTHISAVTVFANQATIVRNGSVNIPAGDSVIVITGIPNSLVKESVLAKGRSEGRVVIGSVDVLKPLPTNAEQDTTFAEAKIRELESKIEELSAKEYSFEVQKEFLKRLISSSNRSDGTNQKSLSDEPKNWKEAFDAAKSSAFEADAGLRHLKEEKTKLKTEIDKIKASSSGYGKSINDGFDVAISVNSDRPARFEIETSYQVQNAYWHPVYQARLDSKTGKLVLEKDAIVTQLTGEDWKDVQVKLSTTSPSASIQPPALSSWRIGLFAPSSSNYMDSAGRASSSMVSAGAASASAPAIPVPPPPMGLAQKAIPSQEISDAVVQSATISSSGLSVEYQIPGQSSVLSGKYEKKLHISDVTNTVKIVDHVIPRLDPHAYYFAKFTNASTVPLLPGQISLYLDGVFVGKSKLDIIRPSEIVNLPFGVDDNLKVTWQPQDIKLSTESHNFSHDKRIFTETDFVKLENFHKSDVNVVVFDQTPVSTDGDLKIDVKLDPEPTDRKVEDKDGVVSWDWTMSANQIRDIKIGFTITAPEGRDISGFGNKVIRSR